MNWARIACAVVGHAWTAVATPGYAVPPAQCIRCGKADAGHLYPAQPPMPPIKLPAQPAFERAQIITAKAGDTIAVMSDAYMSAQERLLLIALVAAKLPEGVKVMVLDKGMRLAHVEAGSVPPPSAVKPDAAHYKWRTVEVPFATDPTYQII